MDRYPYPRGNPTAKKSEVSAPPDLPTGQRRHYSGGPTAPPLPPRCRSLHLAPAQLPAAVPCPDEQQRLLPDLCRLPRPTCADVVLCRLLPLFLFASRTTGSAPTVLPRTHRGFPEAYWPLPHSKRKAPPPPWHPLDLLPQHRPRRSPYATTALDSPPKTSEQHLPPPSPCRRRCPAAARSKGSAAIAALGHPLHSPRHVSLLRRPALPLPCPWPPWLLRVGMRQGIRERKV